MTDTDLRTPLVSIDPETSALYLSRLELNRRNRLVHREIGDSQAFHRRLLDAFPRLEGTAADSARAAHGILYRLDPQRGDAGAVIVLVQSVSEPNWSVLPPDYLNAGYDWGADWNAERVAVKRTDERYRAVAAGDLLRFRLRANPTKKIHTTAENHTAGKRPTGPNGTRKPLTRDELPAWLTRKGGQHGFHVLEASDQPDPISGKEQIGWKPERQRLTHAAVLFEGVLEVTDRDRFLEAIWIGIGSGKAYGFGLLSVAPMGRWG